MWNWVPAQDVEHLFPTISNPEPYSQTKWFYSAGGKKHGPIDSAELRGLILRRDLLPTDLVRADGEKGWKSVSELPEKALQGPPSLPVEARQYSYAGFTKRAMAFGIDFAILFTMALLMESMFNGYVPPISILYFAGFESSSWQATFGKRIMGIRVINKEGERLTYWQAVVRDLSKIVSVLTVGIGFVMAGFTPCRQTLHDMLSNTLVINKDA